MGIAADPRATGLSEDPVDTERVDKRLRGLFWVSIVVVEAIWLSALGYGLSVLLA